MVELGYDFASLSS